MTQRCDVFVFYAYEDHAWVQVLVENLHRVGLEVFFDVYGRLLVMRDEQIPPHHTVEVRFANSDYVNVCETYGGGWQLLGWWQDLGDLLVHRPGWYFEMGSGQLLWNLGTFGASMLNIHVDKNGNFHCFDYADDEAVQLRTVGEIEAWLAPREANARQPTTLQDNLLKDSDWRILRSGASVFDVRISWSDGWYYADVRGLPEEAVFEKTVKAVIKSARAMLVRSFGAPDDVAPQLTLRVALDEKASARFTSD